MNSCVVRVPGPAVAKVIEPRPLLVTTGSSGIRGVRRDPELSHKTIDDPEEPHPVKKPRDDQLMQPISPYWSELAANLDRE
jgi:hypothetical protein